MRVAITGGSGVVGSAVLRHLVTAGYEVRALARSAISQRAVAAAGAIPVPGDILDSQALDALVNGCQRVFHVAGVNQLCSADRGALWAANVTGTARVVEACARAGVARLVHTSSAVTIGERRGEIGIETTEHRGWYLSDYERSKHHAEQLALENRADLEVVVVNPSSVQGPGRATGTGRVFLSAARRRLPFAVETHFSVVDIDDCARGHLLASERGIPGERYLLSGTTLSMREALVLISLVTRRRPVVMMLPPVLLSALAIVVEGAYRLSGRPPPLCREMARVLRFGHRYDGSKASEELGLSYTPVAETLKRTVAWFEEEGLLGGRSVVRTPRKSV